MRQRAMTILWPAFLMAGVLEGFVFSALDPTQFELGRLGADVSPQGVYTLAFLVFWAVLATSGALTVLLMIDPDAAEHPTRRL
jgi:hypothetical protein